MPETTQPVALRRPFSLRELYEDLARDEGIDPEEREMLRAMAKGLPQARTEFGAIADRMKAALHA